MLNVLDKAPNALHDFNNLFPRFGDKNFDTIQIIYYKSIATFDLLFVTILLFFFYTIFSHNFIDTNRNHFVTFS